MQKTKCAIYVRKSSERGLDQEFNSLDNQELACKSYIASQTFQGWTFAKTYSDAAISGGTMTRPGLQELLDDIRDGKIQCVLVYKIDRLSRSIYDFKRMMKEDFEPHGCNLVSITQSFDTSTAMGKLTLNMLLSFAEFEREVASERVRDKMRATKSKGMWVGGVPPLGYDIQFGKLVPNETEIPIVMDVFNTYLESTGLLDCRDKIIAKGIRGKAWLTKKGEEKGGREMTADIVERVLKNQIYLGKLPNKSSNEVFDGQHEAIVPQELFDAVQQRLADNRNYGDRPYCRGLPLLHQKVFTAAGEQFKNRTGNKQLKQYRYYKAGKASLPAGDVEKIVCDEIKKFLDSDMTRLPEEKRLALKQVEFSEPLVKQMIEKIVYADHKLTIFINMANTDYLAEFRKDGLLNHAAEPMDWYLTKDGKQLVIEKQIYISTRTCINRLHEGGEKNVLTKIENATMLIKALAYGWKYKKDFERGTGIKALAEQEKRNQRTIYKYLNLAYLSPNITNAIMNNEVPPHVNLQTLFKIASACDSFPMQEKFFYAA